jgi:uncharacterized membrane protein
MGSEPFDNPLGANLRSLLERLLREEIFRSYVARRAWFLVPLIALVLIGLFVGVFLGVATVAKALQPHFAVRGYGLMLFGAILWLIIAVWFLYVFFSWLEKRALRTHDPHRI